MTSSRVALGLLLASPAAVLTHWLCLFGVFILQDVTARGWADTLGNVGYSLFFFAFFGLSVAVLATGLSYLVFYRVLQRLRLLRASVVIGLATILGVLTAQLVWTSFGISRWGAYALLAGAAAGAAAGVTFWFVTLRPTKNARVAV